MTEDIWSTWAWAALKGLVGGVASHLAQRLLQRGQSELEKLQAKPPEMTDRYKEELLAHFVESSLERIEDAKTLTIAQSFRIIRLRTGVFATCLYLKVRKLEDGEDIRDI
jgi:uncharacterized membrane-anchored protein YhcB (DUF1043 family)